MVAVGPRKQKAVGQAAEEARRGMVAAAHHLASEAAVEIMRQGAKSVDAGLVLGVRPWQREAAWDQDFGRLE